MNEPPAIALRPNVSFLTLGVEDLGRARGFYRGMGLLEHPSSSDHVAFFEFGGQLLALFPRAALAADIGLPPGRPRDGVTTSFSQNVHEQVHIDELLARAEAHGGTILKPASAPAWGGIRGYFADPDGFVWEIAWNPRTTIDEAGRVFLGG
ncbi:MAG: VOC family protein [Planctomycetota bacterium]|nr:VOC family protein [Planctomycetota bacterium]